jgi:hypothetical protein
VLLSGVCEVDWLLVDDEGLVAVDEDDWLEGDVLLWLEVCPLELVALELVFGVEDVAAGLCEVSVLWPDVLELCAQAIAVASTATAAVIKILFIPVSSMLPPPDVLPSLLNVFCSFLFASPGAAMAFGLLRFICPRKTLCRPVGRGYREVPQEERKYAVQAEWKLKGEKRLKQSLEAKAKTALASVAPPPRGNCGRRPGRPQKAFTVADRQELVATFTPSGSSA